MYYKKPSEESQSTNFEEVGYVETTAPRFNQGVAAGDGGKRRSSAPQLDGFQSVVYSPPKEKDHPMGGLSFAKERLKVV